MKNKSESKTGSIFPIIMILLGLCLIVVCILPLFLTTIDGVYSFTFIGLISIMAGYQLRSNQKEITYLKNQLEELRPYNQADND